MGNGMNKVMPGLYVGNYRDSKDLAQLDTHRITHILAIHDSPKHLHPDKHYLCVMAADNPEQNLSQYFSVCNDFIHSARLKDNNVLIHCLAGMSRSVTVTVAYIMSVTPLTWREALKVVRVGRQIANPNSGFQMQLQDFEINRVLDERKRMKERYPSLALQLTDLDYCNMALENYNVLLTNKDICNGDCKRGENCPTGVCRMDGKQALRRKPSVSSCRLQPPRSGSQSCPSSPRHTKSLRTCSSLSSTTLNEEDLPSTSTAVERSLPTLHRSPTSVSQYRPRSSPSGLYSYTNSLPPSRSNSRVDLLEESSKNTGSVIYLGGAGGSQKNPGLSGSRLSLVSKSSSRSSSPTASPKRRPRPQSKS